MNFHIHIREEWGQVIWRESGLGMAFSFSLEEKSPLCQSVPTLCLWDRSHLIHFWKLGICPTLKDPLLKERACWLSLQPVPGVHLMSFIPTCFPSTARPASPLFRGYTHTHTHMHARTQTHIVVFLLYLLNRGYIQYLTMDVDERILAGKLGIWYCVSNMYLSILVGKWPFGTVLLN